MEKKRDDGSLVVKTNGIRSNEIDSLDRYNLRRTILIFFLLFTHTCVSRITSGKNIYIYILIYEDKFIDVLNFHFHFRF